MNQIIKKLLIQPGSFLVLNSIKLTLTYLPWHTCKFQPLFSLQLASGSKEASFVVTTAPALPVRLRVPAVPVRLPSKSLNFYCLMNRFVI